MTANDHWAVTVSRNGERIVTIESNCLSGREITAADEQTIRTAANHLLSFIGDCAAPQFLTGPLAQVREAGLTDDPTRPGRCMTATEAGVPVRSRRAPREDGSDVYECERHCSVCDGSDHHWMVDFTDDGEPIWSCKHCDLTKPYLGLDGELDARMGDEQ